MDLKSHSSWVKKRLLRNQEDAQPISPRRGNSTRKWRVEKTARGSLPGEIRMTVRSSESTTTVQAINPRDIQAINPRDLQAINPRDLQGSANLFEPADPAERKLEQVQSSEHAPEQLGAVSGTPFVSDEEISHPECRVSLRI